MLILSYFSRRESCGCPLGRQLGAPPPVENPWYSKGSKNVCKNNFWKKIKLNFDTITFGSLYLMTTSDSS